MTTRTRRTSAPAADSPARARTRAPLRGAAPVEALAPFVDRILPGDCVEVLAGLPERSVDLVFADPPYNLQLESELLRPNQSRVDGVDADWDRFESFAAYDAFTEAWLSACRRVLKDDGTLWVIGSYHNIYRVGRVLMDLGYWILNDVHWVKSNPMPNFRGTRFTNATETMLWAKKSRDQARYTFHYHTMKALNDDLQMRNTWEIPLCMGAERLKVEGKKAHATQKPEALLYRVLSSSSNPGDVVLDPFSGSGTTAAVARKLGRRFIAIEREPAYVALGEARVAAVTESVPPALLRTPSRRTDVRIPFGTLLELGLLRAGAVLHARDGAHAATVAADGTLRCADGFVGSIHRAGAHVQGAAGCNGWEFWHLTGDDGVRRPIETLREAARKVREAPAPASDDDASDAAG